MIKKGTIFITKHKFIKDTVFRYMIIQDPNTGKYMLVNLDTGYLMTTFKSYFVSDVKEYIEDRLNMTILKKQVMESC